LGDWTGSRVRRDSFSDTYSIWAGKLIDNTGYVLSSGPAFRMNISPPSSGSKSKPVEAGNKLMIVTHMRYLDIYFEILLKLLLEEECKGVN
jgi:hypothetical protein